jgi:hypothetical protein
MSDRYFVDERTGCIAVRDRELTDPDYRGLHSDTPGVVKYWTGDPVVMICPHCQTRLSGGWELKDEIKSVALELCAALNAGIDKAESVTR